MKRVAAVLLMAAACRAGPAPLRLGTTYTVQQSGALAVLESLWTGPAPLTTVVAPSGQILRAAANGDLDVVITHVPELALWRAAGVTPAPRWYLESGADQAATLHLADERRAYALADLPTYAKLDGLASRILFAADTALTNPYTLYLVRRPAPHPDARAFATWAIHAGREAVLALRLPDGTRAFVPRPGDCEATARS